MHHARPANTYQRYAYLSIMHVSLSLLYRSVKALGAVLLWKWQMVEIYFALIK